MLRTYILGDMHKLTRFDTMQDANMYMDDNLLIYAFS
jgi:hypothetical protein